MRSLDFSRRNVFGASVARWLLIIAAGSTATACSGDRLARVSSPAEKSATLLHSGDAAREKGELAAAAISYAGAIAADPSSVEAELRLGSVELARKDENSARSAYQAAQKLAPKNPEAAFRLGEIDLKNGEAKAASDRFAIALESRQDDPKLYNAMGVALSMQGRYEPAKENYDKGLALAPGNPSLHNNYGLLQLARGDLQGALATFSALVASPQANDRYRLNRALVELALGETEAALADAPGMDEPGLRQTLAIYQAPAKDKASADAGPSGAATASGGANESPWPNVHLAVDPPAVPTAANATATASIKPVAGLPPAASP